MQYCGDADSWRPLVALFLYGEKREKGTLPFNRRDDVDVALLEEELIKRVAA